MSPISSGIAVARRAHRLAVRQNGGLSVSQEHSLASDCPNISQQPAHRSDALEVRSQQ